MEKTAGNQRGVARTTVVLVLALVCVVTFIVFNQSAA